MSIRDDRNKLGLTRFAVKAFQILSLLPVLYVVAASVYPYGLAHQGPMFYSCQGAFAALPRGEVLALSLLYRLTKSEIALVVALPVLSLAVALPLEGLLKAGGKKARVTRWALAGLLVADLVLRLIPACGGATFGLGFSLFGIVFQILCLALVLIDLVKAYRAPAAPGEAA